MFYHVSEFGSMHIHTCIHTCKNKYKCKYIYMCVCTVLGVDIKLKGSIHPILMVVYHFQLDTNPGEREVGLRNFSSAMNLYPSLEAALALCASALRDSSRCARPWPPMLAGASPWRWTWRWKFGIPSGLWLTVRHGLLMAHGIEIDGKHRTS